MGQVITSIFMVLVSPPGTCLLHVRVGPSIAGKERKRRQCLPVPVPLYSRK